MTTTSLTPCTVQVDHRYGGTFLPAGEVVLLSQRQVEAVGNVLPARFKPIPNGKAEDYPDAVTLTSLRPSFATASGDADPQNATPAAPGRAPAAQRGARKGRKASAARPARQDATAGAASALEEPGTAADAEAGAAG